MFEALHRNYGNGLRLKYRVGETLHQINPFLKFLLRAAAMRRQRGEEAYLVCAVVSRRSRDGVAPPYAGIAS